MNIVIQIIGIAAMLFSVFSFQMNKHKHIMIMQILATTLFGLQYFYSEHTPEWPLILLLHYVV